MASKTETAATQAGVARASDQDISDGYIYLLGRLTVTRQQQLDFQEGFKWRAKYAKYFWSVIAVDAKHMRVLPNPLNRFLLNNQSKLEYGEDASLTLYFASEKPTMCPRGTGCQRWGGRITR